MHYHVKDYSATVSGLSVLGYNSCADDSFLHSAFFHHFYAFFFMLKSHGGYSTNHQIITTFFAASAVHLYYNMLVRTCAPLAQFLFFFGYFSRFSLAHKCQ